MVEDAVFVLPDVQSSCETKARSQAFGFSELSWRFSTWHEDRLRDDVRKASARCHVADSGVTVKAGTGDNDGSIAL